MCQRVQAGLAQAAFEQKRHLVELLIDRVVVTDGDVEIRYVIPTTPASEHVRFCHLRTDYFDAVALAIRRAIKAWGAPLVRLAWDHRPDTAAAQIAPHRPTAVRLVAGHPRGPHPWPAPPRALDRALLHERHEDGLLVALARRQQERHGLAAALGPQVELGAEPALAPPEGLLGGPPFARRAPAAC